MTKPFLRIIVGSTASGKERLALECAALMDAEIISVDSMKVYRGLDVATAKAGREERERVRHHCLDLIEPTETFSASDFVAAASAAIDDIVSRGKIPILSGGTAFYYKALLEGLFEGPGADPELRAGLEARAEREGSGSLHHELTEKDPDAAAKIHPSDLRRIVRALEVAALTGQGISSRQTQWAGFHAADAEERTAGFFARPLYPFAMVRIVRDRADVHERIRSRIIRMAASGLREEAETVFLRRAEISRTPLQAVGYKEFFPHFSGEETWDGALEKLRLATNRLVRSQDTWFRKFPAREIRLSPESRVGDVAAELAATVFSWAGKS